MGLRQANPGGGGRSRSDHFSYLSTDPKAPWTGWLAGPIQWLEAHPSEYGTKPCLKWITTGALPCPRCKPFFLPVTVGYVPVYREVDGAAKLVIVYDTVYDAVCRLEHLTYVLVSRAGSKKEGVAVNAVEKQKRYETTLERRKVPVDITQDLLMIWKLNELTEWYQANNSGVTPVTPTKVAMPEAPPAPGPAVPLLGAELARAFAQRAQLDQEQAERSKKNAEFARRAQASNGHLPHKPKPR